MITLTHFSKVRLKIIRINFNKCCHAYMMSGRTQKLLIVNLRRLKLPPSMIITDTLIHLSKFL